jgi:uncharacterized protein
MNWEKVRENGWQTRKEGEFRILSIDGGGMKGIFPAQYLKRVEEKIESPLYQHFDLITGTSTGGIIALGLSFGISADQILNMYLENGKRIFGSKRGLFGIRKSKHSNEGLKAVLQETFKQHQLKEVNNLVCIPSIEHQKAMPKVYKTPHSAGFFVDGDTEIWKIALATSAAPVYLPAAIINDNECKVDGGLWANNPVVTGIAEGIKLKVPLEQIKVLSIGTGASLFERKNKKAMNGGLLSWNHHLVDFTMQAQSKGAHFTAEYLIGDRLCRINFDTSLKIPMDTVKQEHFNQLIHEANDQFDSTFVKSKIQTSFFNELHQTKIS